ncbi:DEAD/DEAH box helicase [Paracnuella aquatica]|uniref:DEAD/DEAH box helicase n=1 Tax=Paracnuella aquatica TaxID=2268757 RepID=UPI0013906D9B|nr:DEAD/DEAH box helicase [Paracnuella aquatica]
MARAFELIKSKAYLQYEDELLSIAKGLEIFSLKNKKDFFTGVNQNNNLLYAAGLYYLADYSASAYILANLTSKDAYTNEIDKFILGFLKRDLSDESYLEYELKAILTKGSIRKRLFSGKISRLKEAAFDESYDEYCSLLLLEAIIEKFESDNIWTTLFEQNNSLAHWRPFVEHNLNKKVPIWNFFPSQKKAIESGVLENKTCSLQMPTSAGKSSIAELIIYDEFTKNQSCKILYLVPFRALASELKSSLVVSLSELGVKSKTIYGGSLPTAEEKSSINDVNLLISTPEKFMAIEDVFPDIAKTFSTIICDEGHLLDDESRGLDYELLLSRLKEDVKDRRFIFISAIIPNIATVNNWLGGTDASVISSLYRPTLLEFAFLNKMESRTVGYYLDINPTYKKPFNYQLYRFLYGNELNIANPKNGKVSKISSQKGLCVAVSLKAANIGSIALFAPHKRGNTGVEGLVAEMISQCDYREGVSLTKFSNKKYLTYLEDYFSVVFGNKYLLVESVKRGFLFHHGDFPQGVREIIEDAIRSSNIRLVICTNTLAEGVNLPIRTIVIASTKRFNPEMPGNYETIKIRDLKNLVGRAGRAGKETKGLVIIPNSDDFNTIRNLIEETNVEPVKGHLYNVIKIITAYLKKRRLKISNEVLDDLGTELQLLLDSIDISIIDLLSEKISVEELKNVVNAHLKNTLSFYQSDIDEKQTLETLFEIRSEKLLPIIENNEFRLLKNSGTSLRMYEEIRIHFDFEDQVWNEDVDPLDDQWIGYILEDGIFKLEQFKAELISFNETNKCEITLKDLTTAIVVWLDGGWYGEIGDTLGLETYQTLRLVNSFICYNIQTRAASIIRLKELNTPNYELPIQIFNWPSYIQFGVANALQLSLIEMGLNDRIAILEMSDILNEMGHEFVDYNILKSYLYNLRQEIMERLSGRVPFLSYEKVSSFIEQLQYRNIL